MQPHLTNLEFIVGGFALIVVAIFALATYLDGRKAKTPPFRNYFCTEFDQEQFLQDSPHQDSFSGPNEWLAYTQERRQAYEARTRTPQSSKWE